MTTTKLVTADELLRMPDDGYRYELFEGHLVKMTPAGYTHDLYDMRVGSRLAVHVGQHGLGQVTTAETGSRSATDPDTERTPDAAFVSQARIDAAGEEQGYWTAAPDLAVEVASPNDTYTAVASKAMDWLDSGSRAVMVVDPRRESVTVSGSRSDIVILTGDEVLEIQDVVPGWTLPLRELFG